MINSVQYSPSFQKKLVANANILSKNFPEKVNIYELEPRKEEKDKYYFQNLLFTKDWRKSKFCKAFHRSIANASIHEHFYVMEDKKDNCLGIIKINDDTKFLEFQDIEYIETNPKYANYYGQSSKKYIGETLLTFATKVFDKNHSEGISVATPVLVAEEFYTDKCGFKREVEDELKLTLKKENFDKLVLKNEAHTKGKIKMVG